MRRRRLDQVARAWAFASFVAWIALLMFALGTFDAATAQGASMTLYEPPPSTQGADAIDEPGLEQRRSEPQTTVDEVSGTVMCPSCETTLDQSNSPAADSMRAWVEEAVAAGWTDDEIRDGLVEEYGGDESILATPRADTGLGIAVWAVPAGIVLVALVTGIVLMRGWKDGTGRGFHPDQTRSGSSSNAHSSSGSASPSKSSTLDDAAGEPPSPSSSR